MPTTSVSLSNENFIFVRNRTDTLKQSFSKTINGIVDDERMRAAHEVLEGITARTEERAERLYPKAAAAAAAAQKKGK